MIEQLVQHAEQLPDYKLDTWSPEFKGDMDLVIAADGVWYHQGEPIVKTKIMQLFGRLLQRQTNGDYWIVTPVEAFRIVVKDLPFMVIAADCINENDQQIWQFTTNTGDQIKLLHPKQLIVTYDAEQQPHPKLNIRPGLAGRISRSVYYQLALACEVEESPQGAYAVLTSGSHQYLMGSC
ncbi:MAG: DUF1285 domain-containing protein [Gammaproteobacteria bacterium]|nr:DUF1285 domain-containing protein [Gammaproteobacteria bacterium]